MTRGKVMGKNVAQLKVRSDKFRQIEWRKEHGAQYGHYQRFYIRECTEVGQFSIVACQWVEPRGMFVRKLSTEVARSKNHQAAREFADKLNAEYGTWR